MIRRSSTVLTLRVMISRTMRVRRSGVCHPVVRITMGRRRSDRPTLRQSRLPISLCGTVKSQTFQARGNCRSQRGGKVIGVALRTSIRHRQDKIPIGT